MPLSEERQRDQDILNSWARTVTDNLPSAGDLPARIAAWDRGFQKGALVGMVVTTVLLGGGMAFIWFAGWLAICA